MHLTLLEHAISAALCLSVRLSHAFLCGIWNCYSDSAPLRSLRGGGKRKRKGRKGMERMGDKHPKNKFLVTALHDSGYCLTESGETTWQCDDLCTRIVATRMKKDVYTRWLLCQRDKSLSRLVFFNWVSLSLSFSLSVSVSVSQRTCISVGLSISISTATRASHQSSRSFDQSN